MRLWCGLLILLLCPASSRAAVPVLVQSETGPASVRTKRLQARLASQLGGRVRQGAGLVKTVRRALGRSARPLPSTRLDQLVAAVKAGAEHGYAGDWKRAVTSLQSARQGLMGDVLSLARKRLLFRALQRARLLLVMCYLRLKKPRLAWAMMEEGLRTQPDLSPSGALYGPELQRLYYRVKAQLDLQKARLRVTTDPPGALIFLSGRSIGFSPVTVHGLYPGTYDLLVVKGKQHSRIRRLQLKGAGHHVRLDLGLEAAVRFGGQVALRMGAGARGRSVALGRARRLGQLAGAGRVLLVGAHRLAGSPVLLGRLVDCVRGRVLRAGYVSLTGADPGPGQLAGLARYLLDGGTPGPGVHLAPTEYAPPRARRTVGLPPPRDVARTRAPTTGFGYAGWILLGGGLIAATTGGVLWGLDGQTRIGASREADRYNTDRAGMVALGVGLGTAALGAALLIVDGLKRKRKPTRRTRSTLLPLLGPTRGGWAVGLRGRF